MKDWLTRSAKTFVQAFFGVLIPAVCTMLSNGWPESVNAAWVILAPTVAAALAAAICAVWNIILEAMGSEEPEVPYTDEHPPDLERGKHETDAFPDNWFELGDDQWRGKT